MHTGTTPDASVTLYYTHNRALLAYDTSSCKKDKDAEQYHITVPEYRAPDISYKKKLVDVLQTSKYKTRNIEIYQINRTVVAMSLLTISSLCHFLYWKQLISWKEVKHIIYHQLNQCVNNQ